MTPWPNPLHRRQPATSRSTWRDRLAIFGWTTQALILALILVGRPAWSAPSFRPPPAERVLPLTVDPPSTDGPNSQAPPPVPTAPDSQPGGAPRQALASQERAERDPARPQDGPQTACWERFELPLTGVTVEQFKRLLAANRVGGKQPQPTNRQTMILEFVGPSRETSAESEFESALALARLLSSESVSRRYRTVAYIRGSVRGHAVLPILACERLLVAPGSELGGEASGTAEDRDQSDAIVLQAYRDVAGRRGMLPAAVAVGLLDPEQAVYRVEVAGGVRFVDEPGLAALQTEESVQNVMTIFSAGQPGLLSASQLVDPRIGFASDLVADRAAVLEALRLKPPDVLGEVPPETGWKARRIRVQGRMHADLARRVLKQVDEAIRDQIDLLCIQLDSPGGSLTHSRQLAGALAELDGQRIRTVAWVDRQARGDAALVALGCDEVLVHPDGVLGGPGDSYLDEQLLGEWRPAIEELCRRQGYGWSLWMGLLDPQLAVSRYRRPATGETRLLCERELQQRHGEDWVLVEAMDLSRGLRGAAAVEAGIARQLVASQDDFQKLYPLQGPLELAQRSWLVEAVERLAARPWLARTLLFIAFFALLTELSAPGVGAPGFVSALCFLLFFWTQFLNGTADWLEVLLFVGGLVCVIVEIFVIPGIGIFGVGGGLMMLAALALATQTFVIPRNSYQFDQLPESLTTILVALFSVGAAAIILPRLLPHTPFLRHLMLARPSSEDQQRRHQRESLVHWDFLAGKTGQTTTRLTPSGKARFGDQIVDVISDGQLVPVGTPVLVEEVRGNHVLVRPLEEDAQV